MDAMTQGCEKQRIATKTRAREPVGWLEERHPVQAAGRAEPDALACLGGGVRLGASRAGA